MTPSPDSQPRLSWNRTEIAGSLGDLGTFLPLLVGMVHQCSLQLGPALLFAGLSNIVTGVMFGIPMAVQPMKAIAAVAIAEGMNESQILIAGIATGAAILVLGLTGLIDWLNRVLPLSVVRGLQLALGLKLLSGGFGLIAGTKVMFGWDSIALGVVCAALVLYLYFSSRVPGALVIFALGLIALAMDQPSLFMRAKLGFTWHVPDFSRWEDWRQGMWRGALPQLPLTTMNSVIAVCALSRDLFPHRPANPRTVAVSVGLMNLLGCPLGAMPLCHGAGGLAAQYRFGARTGGSVVLLGIAKSALAVLFGASLFVFLQEYPQSVLGVLLLFSGLELSVVCRDQSEKTAFFIMMLTAGACLAINTAVGTVVGWILALALLKGVFHVEART